LYGHGTRDSVNVARFGLTWVVLVGQLLEGFMSSSHVLRSDVSVLKDVPVLVVEDSWHVAKAMKSALEQLGMRVVGPAATTSEARRLTAGQTPRLALVDVNLKKELACDLIEELHGQGIPVIVVSGYAVPPLPERTVAAFLQKPFSEGDLITILRATVARLAARLH
jgi:DNA-binding response OmpR family regulator